MKKSFTDSKLISGIIFACFLIHISFNSQQVFWYLYTATMLFLISLSIITERIKDDATTNQKVFIGGISGLILYFIFFVGNKFITLLPGTLEKQIALIYKTLSFEWFWHYLVLFIVIIPGEEIFWRGFIQKRLMKHIDHISAVILAASLNGLAYYFSGYPVLMIAGFISGIYWGFLYIWKRSLPLVIISHLIFDLLLLVIYPLS